MTPAQKNEVISVLKNKFNQYSNFYITNTESLTVAQVNKLRRICFDKKVELRVAKNTLIKKAMTALDEERYKGTFDALNGVTALLFCENAKEPALIISSFRKDAKTEIPILKAAFVDGAVFVGNNQLESLMTLKGKKELLGEVIGLLQSPIQRVMGGINAGNKIAGLVKALEERGN